MKDIVSLRNHLFEQLNRLADASKDDLDLEVNRAASIVQVSESIIKTAEVENSFIAITKTIGSGFVPVVGNGKPFPLIKQIEQRINDSEKEETFNVDKKDNWITG